MFNPKPILIEIDKNDILVKEINGNKVFGEFSFDFILRPSGKVIKVDKTKVKKYDSYKTFSFSPKEQKLDIMLLQDLIKKVTSVKFPIVKRVLIWNFRSLPSIEIVDQVEQISFLCDARECLIINNKESLEQEVFLKNTQLDYSFLTSQTQITDSKKSFIALTFILIVFVTLLFARITLSS